MQIRIQYEAQLRRIMEREDDVLELSEPCSVAECIRQLAGKHEKSLNSVLLTDGGEVQPSLLIFVNDSQVLRDDPTPLKDGASLALMTPISGG